MTNLDAVVDELMGVADSFAKNEDCTAYRDALESAIRTALLNVAEGAFKEGYGFGYRDHSITAPGDWTVGAAWECSKTKTALQGDK